MPDNAQGHRLHAFAHCTPQLPANPLANRCKGAFPVALAIALLLALWLVGTGSARAAPATTDAQPPQTLACTACHGPQGKAGPDGYYPRLAGKPAGYLYNQLLNFQQGRRQYAPMQHLLDTLDNRALWEMASYFSALELPYPQPATRPRDARPAPTAQLGQPGQPAQNSNVAGAAAPGTARSAQDLVQKGDVTRGLPACVQCHGRALTGTRPAIPGLLGLPGDYIVAQLGAWQTRQRKAHAPDCMALVAAKLRGGEVSALAQWLSAQTVPVPATPATALPAHQAGGVDVSTAEWRCGSATTPVVTPPATPSLPALVERGAYLARIGNCGQCHTALGGAAYAGGRAIETPFGKVMSGNITADRQFGIGNWSADDFWQALHHGIGKDGRALYPAFPYTSYTRVSRADADALFAYLQTIPPSPTPNQAHALRWPYSTQTALKAWRMLFFTPATPTPETPNAPATQTVLERGRYLVEGLGHCFECHAARNRMGAMKDPGGEGGFVLPASQWYAPSLHPGALQPWSTAALQKFLQTGVSPQGYAAGPMAEVVFHGTQYLSDADAFAMASWLKTWGVSGTPDTPPPPVQGTTHATDKGAAIYRQYCADCHGKSGQGQAGLWPALAGNRNVVQANTNNLVLQLLQGGYPASTAGNPSPSGMPPFVLVLGNADMAAVLTHIRNSWGNRAPAVSEFDINSLRNSLTP